MEGRGVSALRIISLEDSFQMIRADVNLGIQPSDLPGCLPWQKLSESSKEYFLGSSSYSLDYWRGTSHYVGVRTEKEYLFVKDISWKCVTDGYYTTHYEKKYVKWEESGTLCYPNQLYPHALICVDYYKSGTYVLYERGETYPPLCCPRV